MHPEFAGGSIDILARQRQNSRDIFMAGVAAADPSLAVTQCICPEPRQLGIVLDTMHPQKMRFGEWSRVHIVAFGKAACVMAEAAQAKIPESLLADGGVAVTNYENIRLLEGIEVIGAGHPVPDLKGQLAAERIANQVAKAQQDELVLVLVSGGGSALLPAPHPNITLTEKIITTKLLLASGAPISEVNCVRKHLSTLKGGGLARIAVPAVVHALILSDVVGDDLSSIASGPTVPDSTTYGNAINVLKSRLVWEKVPLRVQALLTKGEAGELLETPKPFDPIFEKVGQTLIGSNAISLDAAVQRAQSKGYDTRIFSRNMQGEARIAADQLARHTWQLLKSGLTKPTALIAGGETTVTLNGSGKGGRNQEFALAFTLAAELYQLPHCWVLLSGGTDGRDGPTDAAGGLVDGYTLARLKAEGICAQTLLDNNDSYNALARSQDLLQIGATGTNVADLQILLLWPLA